VANEGLEKARAYSNQVPRDWQLYFRPHLLTSFGQSWVDS